jgi:hypothetical protein
LSAEKFEMLVLLAVNIDWIQREGLIKDTSLLSALGCARSTRECRKTLVAFFSDGIMEQEELDLFSQDMETYASQLDAANEKRQAA